MGDAMHGDQQPQRARVCRSCSHAAARRAVQHHRRPQRAMGDERRLKWQRARVARAASTQSMPAGAMVCYPVRVGHVPRPRDLTSLDAGRRPCGTRPFIRRSNPVVEAKRRRPSLSTMRRRHAYYDRAASAHRRPRAPRIGVWATAASAARMHRPSTPLPGMRRCCLTGPSLRRASCATGRRSKCMQSRLPPALTTRRRAVAVRRRLRRASRLAWRRGQASDAPSPSAAWSCTTRSMRPRFDARAALPAAAPARHWDGSPSALPACPARWSARRRCLATRRAARSLSMPSCRVTP